ncbi:MAG TPA: hypothetical protein VFX92_13115, partial [Candidatus Krumholzibacteria bacterium]|nr:hypothetical protein [Candidatus Krumholzibacteria bacterium]
MRKSMFSLLLMAAVFPTAASVPSGGATAGHHDPCTSTFSSASGVVVACPQGDGDALSDLGLTIAVRIVDATQSPISGI